MSSYLQYLVYGVIGVSIMILWGVYGDLLIEEFRIGKVFRSLFIGVCWASFLFLVNDGLPPFIVALIVIAFERYTTEIYKALIRDERQVKYKIPSDLGIDFPRWIEKSVGYILIAGAALAFAYLNLDANIWTMLLFAAFLPAFGGMLKDAPYEGFFPFKFLRSPVIIVFVAIFLKYLYPDLADKYFLMSLFGGERIVSEFYRKILKGNIPGKFKRDLHHRISHSWKTRRKALLLPYAFCVSALFWLLTLSY